MREQIITGKRGNPALKYGLLFGLLLGALQILLTFLTRYSNMGSIALFITIFGFVIALLAYLFAGIRASRETGMIGTGAFAGLWTGLVSAIIGFLGALLLAFLNLNVLRQQAATATQATADRLHQVVPASSDQLLISAAAATGVTGIVISLLLGLMLGAIGGMIGKGLTSRRPMVAQEVEYRDVPKRPQSR